VKHICISHRRRYPYFDEVAGLTWSEDAESYAGGSIATGRGSHAGLSKVMTQTKRDTLPGWGLGVGLTTSPVKLGFVSKPQLKFRRMEEEGWGGHGPKTGLSAIEEEEEEEY
jgi:hypothetical protein